MSSHICRRCLSKASASDHSLLLRLSSAQSRIPPLRLSIAPFSTSVPLFALPPKKKSAVAKTERNIRGVKRTFTKKKDKLQKVDRSRKPAIGERKALRKRVVLSNDNALEVHDLQDISAEILKNNSLQGRVIGIPPTVVTQLRAVEAFKPAQGWPLFRRPAMLIREETTDLAKEMEEIESLEEGKKRAIRRILVGERGSGKTLMLLQAMTLAFLKGWVVINIPEAQDVVLAQTEYGPIPSTTPTQYYQKTYTANLLSAIARANPILQSLQLSQQPSPTSSNSPIPIPIPDNISLSRLCTLGASDPTAAWPIFQLLLHELTLPNQSRPPLLLTLDGLSHTMQNSHYRSASYELIHAHDLSIIRFFIDHLSGSSPLPNGGIVMAATSKSNHPVVPSLELALGQLESAGKVERDPYGKYDERVLAVFNNSGGSKGMEGGNRVEVQRLGGVGKEEARALMEYWAKSGVCRQRIDEGFVGEKWTMSGGGYVGELERAVVRMRV
ncbi:hypothetical protein ACLMJK_005789 [Lecanora helva]